jgi:hypothetical protein
MMLGLFIERAKGPQKLPRGVALGATARDFHRAESIESQRIMEPVLLSIGSVRIPDSYQLPAPDGMTKIDEGSGSMLQTLRRAL